MKHNQCLGFALTKHGESSRTLFDLIYTRWPAAPKVICYDDGCDFIKYALSREPHFFKNTLVVIDGLDFDDPMGITSNATFDARRYSEVAEMVRVNCAQKDNNLERIKKCALFLDDIDFMTVMSYVVYRMNICRIERI
ncbi:hypothetical protein BKA69DRAFT_1028929 [Paraphysoderma sedebokerense]|nr:hypothetical protein BKA69DRAFT_1028929 [Paraphysoderma sedebokerense]